MVEVQEKAHPERDQGMGADKKSADVKDSNYKDLYEFTYRGGVWFAANDKAREHTTDGEVLTFKEVTARDLKYHRCYFKLLSYIWFQLPVSFQEKVPEDKFYLWLKHLKGQYEVLFSFKDGTKLVEYESISFAQMSQESFERYIKDQLPFVYGIVAKFYSGDEYDRVIEDIEDTFESFLRML